MKLSSWKLALVITIVHFALSLYVFFQAYHFGSAMGGRVVDVVASPEKGKDVSIAENQEIVDDFVVSKKYLISLASFPAMSVLGKYLPTLFGIPSYEELPSNKISYSEFKKKSLLVSSSMLFANSLAFFFFTACLIWLLNKLKRSPRRA